MIRPRFNLFVSVILSLVFGCIKNHVNALESTRTHYLLQTNALNAYQDNLELDTDVYGNCINGPPEGGDPDAPDAQTTRDDYKCQELGSCHVAFTQAGEYVAYQFFHTEDDIAYLDDDGCPVLIVNITVRVAAPGPRNIYLEIYDDYYEAGAATTANLQGLGYHEFEDVEWINVRLEPYNPHFLYVHFNAGNTNMCSVGISMDRPQRLIPFSINALEYDRANEKDNMISGNCQDGQPPIDEPDAQDTTHDEECQALGPCHVAFTQPWEYVVYDFDHSDEYVVDTLDGGGYVFVDITVRVASLEKKKFQIEISNGHTLGPIEVFETPGKGWQEYENVTWRMLPLEPREGTHSALVAFNEGNINFCSITVEYSRYTPPITFGALDYFGSEEHTPNDEKGGCNPRDDGVDIQPTTDEVCILRDNSECNVGWTDEGEYLEYKFYVPFPRNDDYDIVVRLAAKRTGKTVRMELYSVGELPRSQTFDVVSRGSWQRFTDVVWENLYLQENEYRLRITFESGQTNLCSVSVIESTSRYYVFVPGTYSALFYADFFDETSDIIGNCPNTRRFSSVDALIVSDPVCVAARSEHDVACSIGWTNPGEYLIFQFQTDGEHEYVNISFRVSSASIERQMQAEVYSIYGQPATVLIDGPGLGWDTYQTVVWDNVHVGTTKYHEIVVRFLDGGMNLCSFGVEYDDDSQR